MNRKKVKRVLEKKYKNTKFVQKTTTIPEKSKNI